MVAELHQELNASAELNPHTATAAAAEVSRERGSSRIDRGDGRPTKGGATRGSTYADLVATRVAELESSERNSKKSDGEFGEFGEFGDKSIESRSVGQKG